MVLGNSQILVINRVRFLGSGPHTPPNFLVVPPRGGGGLESESIGPSFGWGTVLYYCARNSS